MNPLFVAHECHEEIQRLKAIAASGSGSINEQTVHKGLDSPVNRALSTLALLSALSLRNTQCLEHT